MGFPAIVYFYPTYAKNKAVFSHHISKAKPLEDKIKWYIYYYLYKNQPTSITYHTGSVIWAFDTKGFSENENIIIPPRHILNTFNNIIESYVDKKINNEHINVILSQIRDSLLPRLMSGKIRVPVEVKK